MARVNCDIEEIDLDNDEGYTIDSVRATCSRCGHQVESYGDSERSVNRCLLLMRRECPQGENHLYVRAG